VWQLDSPGKRSSTAGRLLCSASLSKKQPFDALSAAGVSSAGSNLLITGAKRNVEIQVMPTEQEDNAGVDGPFTVITKKGGAQFVYMEVQGRSNLLIDREETQRAAARYGIIRSQALSPQKSLRFIETLLGEL
jgi:uncharacterized protein DUF5753